MENRHYHPQRSSSLGQAIDPSLSHGAISRLSKPNARVGNSRQDCSVEPICYKTASEDDDGESVTRDLQGSYASDQCAALQDSPSNITLFEDCIYGRSDNAKNAVEDSDWDTKPHKDIATADKKGYAASSTIFQLLKISCDIDCSCSCHQPTRFKSPGFLDSIFGSLSVSIQAPPRNGRRCGQFSCRAGRYRLDYSFRLPS